LIKALGPRCLTLSMTSSSSVVRITEMFGSNSPRRPERDRGSTSSPRTSRFPNSIINQRYSALRRFQRQPLIILDPDRIVKRTEQTRPRCF